MDEIKFKESDVTKQILDMLNHIPNVYAYKHWAGPFGKEGIHDIICCFRGKFIAIEVKNPNAKLEYRRKPDGSSPQEDFAWNIKRALGKALLVNSVDQVAEELKLDITLFPMFKGK